MLGAPTVAAQVFVADPGTLPRVVFPCYSVALRRPSHGARPLDLTVLHRDDALVAVAKPSGLLVHRGWGTDRVVALGLVRDLVGRRVHPVHRLDRGTSGVLLFALDKDAARALGAAFAAGEVGKRYLALVRGVAPDGGVVDSPVPVRPKGPRAEAHTEFRLVEALSGTQPRACSLVEARPRTGRLHQVRRHLKHAGHPVLGDANYGKGALNRAFAAEYGLRRLALHAWRLAVPHPTTGERLELTAPVPADLGEPLMRMGFDVAGLDV